MMPLARSGYADTFARDNLPPAAQWPALEFATDLLKYPERLNAAAEIIDVPAAVYGQDRPALKTPDGAVWTYGELRARANQIARVLTEDLGLDVFTVHDHPYHLSDHLGHRPSLLLGHEKRNPVHHFSEHPNPLYGMV